MFLGFICPSGSLFLQNVEEVSINDEPLRFEILFS